MDFFDFTPYSSLSESIPDIIDTIGLISNSIPLSVMAAKCSDAERKISTRGDQKDRTIFHPLMVDIALFLSARVDTLRDFRDLRDDSFQNNYLQDDSIDTNANHLVHILYLGFSKPEYSPPFEETMNAFVTNLLSGYVHSIETSTEILYKCIKNIIRRTMDVLPWYHLVLPRSVVNQTLVQHMLLSIAQFKNLSCPIPLDDIIIYFLQTHYVKGLENMTEFLYDRCLNILPLNWVEYTDAESILSSIKSQNINIENKEELTSRFTSLVALLRYLFTKGYYYPKVDDVLPTVQSIQSIRWLKTSHKKDYKDMMNYFTNAKANYTAISTAIQQRMLDWTVLVNRNTQNAQNTYKIIYQMWMECMRAGDDVTYQYLQETVLDNINNVNSRKDMTVFCFLLELELKRAVKDNQLLLVNQILRHLSSATLEWILSSIVNTALYPAIVHLRGDDCITMIMMLVTYGGSRNEITTIHRLTAERYKNPCFTTRLPFDVLNKIQPLITASNHTILYLLRDMFDSDKHFIPDDVLLAVDQALHVQNVNDVRLHVQNVNDISTWQYQTFFRVLQKEIGYLFLTNRYDKYNKDDKAWQLLHYFSIPTNDLITYFFYGYPWKHQRDVLQMLVNQVPLFELPASAVNTDEKLDFLLSCNLGDVAQEELIDKFACSYHYQMLDKVLSLGASCNLKQVLDKMSFMRDIQTRLDAMDENKISYNSEKNTEMENTIHLDTIRTICTFLQHQMYHPNMMKLCRDDIIKRLWWISLGNHDEKYEEYEKYNTMVAMIQEFDAIFQEIVNLLHITGDDDDDANNERLTELMEEYPDLVFEYFLLAIQANDVYTINTIGSIMIDHPRFNILLAHQTTRIFCDLIMSKEEKNDWIRVLAPFVGKTANNGESVIYNSIYTSHFLSEGWGWHAEAIQFLVSNGCKITEDHLAFARKHHPPVLEWLTFIITHTTPGVINVNFRKEKEEIEERDQDPILIIPPTRPRNRNRYIRNNDMDMDIDEESRKEQRDRRNRKRMGRKAIEAREAIEAIEAREARDQMDEDEDRWKAIQQKVEDANPFDSTFSVKKYNQDFIAAMDLDKHG